MKKYNILVFPCGSEIALEVHNSLKYQKDINLIGVSSVNDHGSFVYKDYIGNAPTIYDDNFIKFFKNLVIEKNINFIYPCIDIVIDKFKQNEFEFNCKIIGSPKETTAVCLSKLKTYNYFNNILKTPKILNTKDIKNFPVFSKPEVGASSRNTVKIEDETDLNYWSKKMPNNLLLEYLPGEEYTVDCFTSRDRSLKFVGPRKRNRISNGISVNTEIVNDPELFNMAKKINDSLVMNGSWFFQAKKDTSGNFCLLEIASRFAGSSSIHRFFGINFSYLNILNELYPNLEIITNDFDIEYDRSLDIKTKSNINFNNAYIDFDDTLVINNKVNCNLIKIIYHLLNDNKNIFLITKHKGNIYNSLKEYNINPDMFSDIIHLKSNDEKYHYIKGDSIFIDDSFSERAKIKKHLNIPVFSAESVNVII
jgi:hypothetical protein